MKTKLNYVIAIPARLTSKRLPNKLAQDVDGHSVLYRTIERCSSLDLPVFVVADTSQLEACTPPDVVFDTLQADARNGTHRLQLWLKAAEAGSALLRDADVIINVQADEMLLDPQIVVRLVAHCEKIAASKHKHRVVTVAAYDCPCAKFGCSHTNVVLRHNKARKCCDALYFSKQEVPLGIHHVGVYAYTKKLLQRLPADSAISRVMKLEQMAWIEQGYDLDVVALPWAAHAINELHDLEVTQQIYAEAEDVLVKAKCLGLAGCTN